MPEITLQDEIKKRDILIKEFNDKGIFAGDITGEVLGRNTLSIAHLPSNNTEIDFTHIPVRINYGTGCRTIVHGKSIIIRRNAGFHLTKDGKTNDRGEGSNGAIDSYSQISAEEIIYVGTPETGGEFHPAKYFSNAKNKNNVGNFCELKAKKILVHGDIGMGSKLKANEILVTGDIGTNPVHSLGDKAAQVHIKAKEQITLQSMVFDNVKIEIEKGGFIIPQKNARISDFTTIQIGSEVISGASLKRSGFFEQEKKISEDTIKMVVRSTSWVEKTSQPESKGKTI